MRPRDISREIHVKPLSVPKVIQELSSLQWIQVVSGPRIEENRIEERRKDKETGRLKSVEQPLSEKPKAEKINGKILADLWEQHRGPFSKIIAFNEDRRRKSATQLAKYPDMDHWSSVLEKWKKSDFCTQTWSPGFDDWLEERKRIKTLEGGYDNKQEVIKKDQWVEMAVQVTGVLRKIGNMESDSGDKIRAIVGDRVFQIMRGVHGGIFGLRMMPENDFKLKKMANLLKESAEKGIKNDSKSEGIGEHRQSQNQEFS